MSGSRSSGTRSTRSTGTAKKSERLGGRLHAAFESNCTVEDLKKKRDSLMATFRAQLRKATDDKDYTPIWFAYEKMASFLTGAYIPRCRKNAEGSSSDTGGTSREQQMIEDLEDKYFNDLDSFDCPEYDSKSHLLMESIKRKAESTDPDSDPLEIHTPEFCKPLLRESEVVDSCSQYVQLLAKKLKRLDENTRAILMHEIDSLINRKRTGQNGVKHVSDLKLNNSGSSDILEKPDQVLSSRCDGPVSGVTSKPANTYLCNKLHTEDNLILSQQLAQIREDIAKCSSFSDMDEADLCMKSWSLEYKKLRSDQQLHVKKAINDVLYEGRLGRLSAGSVQIMPATRQPSTKQSNLGSGIALKTEVESDCE